MLLAGWKNVVRRWFSSSRRRRGTDPVVGIERLEVRSVMSASTPAVVSTSGLHSLDEIPQLDSNPDAFAQLYLDFDGHFESEWSGRHNINSPVFSLDADRTTYSEWELATIREVWAIVAEDFAPFNLNVTTIEPADFADGHALRVVIGGSPYDWFGSGAGGVATHAGFTNGAANVVYVFPDYGGRSRDEAVYIADIVSHEAGHGFGLDHQSQYDANGVLVNCYRPGTNGIDPIMGGSQGYANRTTWSMGASTSASTTQDDLAFLASVLGYRQDDAGADVQSATTLDFTNGQTAIDGVIDRMGDVDAFQIHSDGGLAVFNVSSNLLGANLVLTAELKSLSGETIVRAGSTDLSTAGLQAQLPAGDYLLIVTSNGEYGSVGQYHLEGSITATATVVPEVPTGVVAGSEYGYRHELSWSAVANAAGYRVYRRPQNGQTASGIVLSETLLVAVLPAQATSVTLNVPRWPIQGFDDRWWADYRVEAFNTEGVATSGWQRTIHEFYPPFATSYPQVTTVSESSVEVTWTPDPRAVGQTVKAWEFVSQNSYTGHSTTTIAAGQSHQVMTGLTPGKRYRFEVSAFTEGGSRQLFYDFTIPHALAPAAPNVQLSLLPGKVVSLTWDSVPGATGYYVSQLDQQGNWRKGTLSASETSFQISRLERDKPYKFIVEAVNASGATATITESLTIPYNPPPQPTGLTATALSTTEVRLTWQSVSAATGYRIYRPGTVSSILVGTIGADQTSFTVTGLTTNTGYSFSVEAFNDDGRSFGWSPFVRTLDDPPTAPGNVLIAPLSPTSVRITWTDSLRETSYEIQQGSGSSVVRTFNSTLCNWYGLVPGTTYQFRVIAKNSGGATASDWVSIRIANPPTGATYLNAVAPNWNSVQLTWNDGQAETGYRIFQQNGTDRSLIATLSADVTSYAVTGLSGNTAYQFSIEAFNADGTKAASFPMARTPLAPPTAPGNFVAVSAAPTQVQLSWIDSANETTYRIERVTNGVTTSTVISAGSTAYTMSGLLPNREYQFRIIAVNNSGSASTNWLTVRTPEAPPSAPTGLRATNVGQTFVSLIWNDIATNETGYRVYQTTSGVERLVTTLAANTIQFTINGLVKETAYRFRVAAFNAVGETRSALLSVTTLAELLPPIRNFTAVAVGSRDVQLTWNDTTGETRYSVYQALGTTGRQLLTNLSANSTSFRVTGLSPRTTYRFQILASNSGGNVQTSWMTVTTL